jgi:hypothetical protein
MYAYLEGSAPAALREFATAESAMATNAAAGIDALMAECPDEACRQRALAALDWAYAPPPGELDAFLIWARDELRAAGTSFAQSNADVANR